MVRRLSLIAAWTACSLLAGACLLRFGEWEDDPDGHTHHHYGGYGTTDVGGTGGVGEAGTGGAAGAPTGGGTGGTGSCVGGQGTGTSIEACNELAITPPSWGGEATYCGPNYDEEPSGFLLCRLAFAIYAPGQAENLQHCLAHIDAQRACDDAPVAYCLARMYSTACPRPEIAEACEGYASDCNLDPFDAELCAAQLNPFGDEGLALLGDCINEVDPSLGCQQAYDLCIQMVTAL